MLGPGTRALIVVPFLAGWSFATAAPGLPRSDVWDSPTLLFEQTPDGYSARGANLDVRLSQPGVDLRTNSGSVEMRLAGGRQVLPSGTDRSPARINHLTGAPSAWRKDVAAYAKVAYDGVYPGIDLVFHGGEQGRGQQLEYDFVVAPHANPGAIQLRWNEVRKLSLNQNGDLIVLTKTGSLQWLAPRLYQDVNGVRKPVEGGFKLLGSNRVAFRIGPYDPASTLVIDPTLAFSTYLGGSLNDSPRAVASDSAGNFYLTGGTRSIDFPVTKGAFQTGYGGGTSNFLTGDAFVAKYSAAGALLFLTYLGGTGDDSGTGIAVDSAGNSYITGYTNSPNFPVTAGVLQPKFAGYAGTDYLIPQGDAFVTKLSADGSTLLYSTYLGGSGDDTGSAIAIDSQGNAYVVGSTGSRKFPVTGTAYQTTFSGSGGQEFFPCCGYAFVGGDAFVTKLNPSGTALVYSTYLGGASDDVATSVALDNSGNVYVGGFTLSPDFPTTSGAFQKKFGGREPQNSFFNFGDGFITKVDPTGSNLVFSTLMGGAGDDWISGLVVDSPGNVYATGGTTSMNFPATTGSFQTAYKGPFVLPFLVDTLFGDAFLLKLNPTGQSLVFATYVGGSGDDTGLALALDPGGNVLVAGFTNSANFPVSAGAIQKTFSGPGPSQTQSTAGDGFFAQFSPAGNEMYATFLGGSSDDVAAAVTVSPGGMVFIAGATSSSDVPLLNAFQSKYAGPSPAPLAGDLFLAALSGFGGGPTITSVTNAAGETAVISQNTWIEIKGSNLSSTTRLWQGSDFVNGQMPSQLDGVSATVNGKPAFVYYISGTQVNVLTPLDSTTGPVQIQIKNSLGTSAAFTVPMQAYTPGLFQFSGVAFAAATHADGTFVGPASLYPGQSFPAKPGEEIVLYGDGFGQTSPLVVNGSASQSGTLSVTPSITIGGFSAQVVFAGLISPGEYQFNVIVPASLPAGNFSVTVTYNNQSTQTGVLVAIAP